MCTQKHKHLHTLTHHDEVHDVPAVADPGQPAEALHLQQLLQEQRHHPQQHQHLADRQRRLKRIHGHEDVRDDEAHEEERICDELKKSATHCEIDAEQRKMEKRTTP
jgi:hypothetical protein